MIKTKVFYLRKEFVVEEDEPSTIPELVALIGEDSVVLNASANLRYRNKYPRVYKRVSIELQKLGFQLNDGQDEIARVSQYLATNPEAHRPILQEMFNRIANEEPLYIKGDRIGGGRIAQGALDAAHRYFAEGASKVTEVSEKIEGMLPNYRVARDVENNITPETLARGIQTLQRHLMSQAKNATKNL